MNMKKRLVVNMVLILGISMFLTACKQNAVEQNVEKSSILVETMTAKKDSLTLHNQFIGNIVPDESVYVIPMAQGTITHTYFEVGDKVEAGDILFKIDDEAASLQLEQATLNYNNAKLQIDSSWDNANTQMEATIDQLEAQKTATLGQLQAAQTQYFTLKDSVDDAEDSLDALEKAKEEPDMLSDDECKLLASLLKLPVTDKTTVIMAVKDPALSGTLPDIIKQTKKTISQAKMSLNTAETSLQAAEEGYEIILKNLEDAKTTDLTDTKKQLDTNLELAKLAVEGAKLSLSYYSVEAPISGTIISKNAAVNGFATSSQPAYIIASDDTMSVTFHVSEAIKNTLSVGAALTVERNGAEFEGAITEVGNAVNQQTGLFQIKGSVYANGTELPSGVSVKLTVETYKALDAIIIPYDAVYYESDGAYVYIAKDNAAVKTMVTTGIFDENSVEITSGITLEDVIITSWSPRLLDGAAVTTKNSEAAN